MKKAHKLLFVFIIFTILLVPSYKVNASFWDWLTKSVTEVNTEGVESIIKEIKTKIKTTIGNIVKKELAKDKDATVDDIRQSEEYQQLLQKYPELDAYLEGIVEEVKKDLERYEENVTECSGIFGDPSNEDSTIFMIQKFLNYIKILAPLLVVVLSGFDFAKNALTGDQDEMKKAGKKLGIRLGCAVGVYLAPLLAGFLINFINNTSMDRTCKLK